MMKPGPLLEVNKETVILGAMAAGLVLFFYFQAKKGVEKVSSAVGSVVKPVLNAANPASQTNAVQKVGTAIYHVISPKAAAQDLTLSTVLNDGMDTVRGWLGGEGPYDPNK